MFNSTNGKSSSAKKPAQNSAGNHLPSVNMISEGTHLKGNLNTKNDIRISGTLEGEANATGKLIITSSGSVMGDVDAADADIAGKMNGEIRVKNKLIIRESAVIDGDIFTKTLLVEEGAQINGTCRMDEAETKSTSRTEKRTDSTVAAESHDSRKV